MPIVVGPARGFWGGGGGAMAPLGGGPAGVAKPTFKDCIWRATFVPMSARAKIRLLDEAAAAAAALLP